MADEALGAKRKGNDPFMKNERERNPEKQGRTRRGGTQLEEGLWSVRGRGLLHEEVRMRKKKREKIDVSEEGKEKGRP